MAQLDQAVREIPTIEVNERRTTFFLIQTKTLKDMLVRTATEYMDLILDRITNSIHLSVTEVTRKYEDLKIDLSNPLKNEQGLQKLLICMSEHEIYLSRLKNEVNIIEGYVSFLELYARKLDYSVFFELYAKPPEVKQAVLEGSINSAAARTRFQVVLDNEKEQFNKEITDLKERHQKIKELEVFDYRNNYLEEVKAAIEFDERLQESIDKAKKFN
jgi:hypothetical protein